MIEKNDDFVEEFGRFLNDRLEAQKRRESQRLAIPPELVHVREMARRAILPIKPTDSNTKADQKFLFTAMRTDAGRKLPPYYLVYFLLVDLLGFQNLGRFEKLAWSVPIEFEGDAYLIEHRKFGVGVFAREGEEWERQAKRIVGLIHRGVKVAKPFYKWLADNAVNASKLNVHNVGRKLFQRYSFLRDNHTSAVKEAQNLRAVHETESKQRQFTFHLHSVRSDPDASWVELAAIFTYPWIRRSEDASWLALAAIDAFFAWTEHIFIHLAILQGKVTTGEQVAQMAEAEWGTKFKCAFDLSEVMSKRHFDKLVIIRRQLRNFMAHGAFGKDGAAFHFHSAAGAVPVVLDHRLSRRQFSLSPELEFDDTEAISTIEEFITYLWSGQRAPARIYIQESDLPLILPCASDGTYSAAMASVQAMTEYVHHQTEEWDRASNMDW